MFRKRMINKKGKWHFGNWLGFIVLMLLIIVGVWAFIKNGGHF